MNNIYKIISFLSLGSLLSYLSYLSQSDFVTKFSENLLGLLATLFAINIASGTLIAGRIKEIEKSTKTKMANSKKVVKDSFIEQIALIGVAVIFGLIRESLVIKQYIGCELTLGISNAVLFFTFISYLDIIRDLGMALFQLLDYDED